MRKLILLTMIISTILLFGCSKNNIDIFGPNTSSNNPVITENTYQNKENNFSLIIPKGRTFKENTYGSIVMFFSPKSSGDKISENIGITIQSMISGANLETLYNQNKDMISKTISGANISDEKNLMINNKPAKSITYSFTQGDYLIKQKQYIVLDNQKFYIITYMALEKTFKDYKDALEKIIGSFKF